MARFPLMPPPGIAIDNTSFASEGAWWDCEKVRFWRERPQSIGGWEALSETALSGVCRNTLCWADNDDVPNYAFGTNTNLQIYYGGQLFDITPTLNYAPYFLRANKLGATSGSAIITVTDPGHYFSTGDTIIVSGATNVGNLTPNGTFTVTVVDRSTYTYTFTSNASATSLPNAPLTVMNASSTVTVNHPSHGLTDGASVTIAGATNVGAITPNGTFTITVIDADSYEYRFTTEAGANATGGGNAVTAFAGQAGGDSVEIAPQAAFVTGSANGAGSAGYGSSYYGLNYYGQPAPNVRYARTWALDNYGQTLIASPRGGTIYQWENNVTQVAQPVQNAPQEITYCVVTPERQILAFGCNEELSGEFNPLCIRGSDIENINDWSVRTDNNAFEQILEGGGTRIVGARVTAYGIFVWTDTSLYLGKFLGDPGQTYRFDLMGRNCGLIGPNAVALVGQMAYWIGQDRQFYGCPLGGAPSMISSPLQKILADNLALGQQDKIVASTISQFGEVWWFYPDDRDTVVTNSGDLVGIENSRYLCMSYQGQGWSRGTLSRTAFIDANPSVSPIGVDYDGNSFFHERGTSANGSAIDWWVESADYYFGEADQTLEIQSVWPDFEDQTGSIYLTLTTRLYPQGVEYTRGPYTIAANRGKRDFRSSGRVARVKIGSSVSPSFARLGKIEFDASLRGLR